jgi:hypothetical protein
MGIVAKEDFDALIGVSNTAEAVDARRDFRGYF